MTFISVVELDMQQETANQILIVVLLLWGEYALNGPQRSTLVT